MHVLAVIMCVCICMSGRVYVGRRYYTRAGCHMCVCICMSGRVYVGRRYYVCS
jgi:hypothetical protein